MSALASLFVNWAQLNWKYDSKIPVMGHADGVCHVYVDKAADLAKAILIIVDSKTQYPAACNAMETLLVHKDIKEDIIGKVMDASPVEIALREGEYKEFLDYIMTVKWVDSLEEAVAHINRFGSHHTDCIITEDDIASEKFMSALAPASTGAPGPRSTPPPACSPERPRGRSCG